MHTIYIAGAQTTSFRVEDEQTAVAIHSYNLRRRSSIFNQQLEALVTSNNQDSIPDIIIINNRPAVDQLCSYFAVHGASPVTADANIKRSRLANLLAKVTFITPGQVTANYLAQELAKLCQSYQLDNNDKTTIVSTSSEQDLGIAQAFTNLLKLQLVPDNQQSLVIYQLTSKETSLDYQQLWTEVMQAHKVTHKALLAPVWYKIACYSSSFDKTKVKQLITAMQQSNTPQQSNRLHQSNTMQQSNALQQNNPVAAQAQGAKLQHLVIKDYKTLVELFTYTGVKHLSELCAQLNLASIICYQSDRFLKQLTQLITQDEVSWQLNTSKPSAKDYQDMTFANSSPTLTKQHSKMTKQHSKMTKQHNKITKQWHDAHDPRQCSEQHKLHLLASYHSPARLEGTPGYRLKENTGDRSEGTPGYRLEGTPGYRLEGNTGYRLGECRIYTFADLETNLLPELLSLYR